MLAACYISDSRGSAAARMFYMTRFTRSKAAEPPSGANKRIVRDFGGLPQD